MWYSNAVFPYIHRYIYTYILNSTVYYDRSTYMDHPTILKPTDLLVDFHDVAMLVVFRTEGVGVS